MTIITSAPICKCLYLTFVIKYLTYTNADKIQLPVIGITLIKLN